MEEKFKKGVSKKINNGAASSQVFNQQAVLTFNLEDIEAYCKLRRMLDVNNYVASLADIDQHLKKILKYESEQMVQYRSDGGDYKNIVPDYDTVEYIRSMFMQILSDNKVDIEELYE